MVTLTQAQMGVLNHLAGRKANMQAVYTKLGMTTGRGAG
jgi:hypothetical protein